MNTRAAFNTSHPFGLFRGRLTWTESSPGAALLGEWFMSASDEGVDKKKKERRKRKKSLMSAALLGNCGSDENRRRETITDDNARV